MISPVLESEEVTMVAWSDVAALVFILVWASIFRRSSSAVAFAMCCDS